MKGKQCLQISFKSMYGSAWLVGKSPVAQRVSVAMGMAGLVLPYPSSCLSYPSSRVGCRTQRRAGLRTDQATCQIRFTLCLDWLVCPSSHGASFSQFHVGDALSSLHFPGADECFVAFSLTLMRRLPLQAYPCCKRGRLGMGMALGRYWMKSTASIACQSALCGAYSLSIVFDKLYKCNDFGIY
jgi:hypothetical protein